MDGRQAELERSYLKVEDEVAEACRIAGRNRSDVLLLAVSKLHPASDVEFLAGLGQKDFGENYVQEALAKRERLAPGKFADNLRWHMIGRPQTRKAPLVAGNFTLLHALDSSKLADAMERRLAAGNGGQDVLLEVNIGAEKQKAGVMADSLGELAEYIEGRCPHLSLKGLMCLPPVFDAGDAARPFFSRLREERDSLEKRLGKSLPILSMGMSGDFRAAIAEGATIVRIGSSIFGPRPKKT